MKLSGIEIYKYLPASRRSECANCGACGFKSCMEFALKCAKDISLLDNCPNINSELKKNLNENKTFSQKEVEIGLVQRVKIGGENVMFRHDKTFVNQTALVVVLNVDDENFEQKLNRVLNFEVSKLSKKYKVDGIFLKGKNISTDFRLEIEKRGVSTIIEDELKVLKLIKVEDEKRNFSDTVENLVNTRREAILNGNSKFLEPTYIYIKKEDNLLDITARASFYICKYANMIIFENFDEAMFSTLITLRQSLYTNPQQPLQVEPKIYEFHDVDERSTIFLTTNFALTYYAVANELEALDTPSYLIVVPTGGMSVLVAWAAEKITTKVVAETIEKFKLREKVKTREIVIPGLLESMKESLQKEIPDFDIIVGTKVAYLTKEFMKTYKIQRWAE